MLQERSHSELSSSLILVLISPGEGEETGEDLVILQRPIERLSKPALERFLRHARRAVKLKGMVNVLVTGSAELRALNRQFLGRNKPTDVLSFPAAQAGLHPARPFAGDVAISAEIARANANRLGHSLAEEIKILALHGVLHLAGFDHERDNGEMARKEIHLRRQLRLPAGLLERADRPSGKAPQQVSEHRGAARSRGAA